MFSPASFLVLVAAVAVLAGAIASVSGFGIGSLLTPLLGVRVGTKLAVAAVSVPHLNCGVPPRWEPVESSKSAAPACNMQFSPPPSFAARQATAKPRTPV